MIINMDGRPTYFMTLKDRAGLIKQYAFVSVSNYTSVGTGETINSALRNFRQVMSGSDDGFMESGESLTITGAVLRIAGESMGDAVIYKIILEEEKELIFTVSNETSNELALTHPGDRIKLTYLPPVDGICQATDFDNLEFQQKKD